MLIKCRILIRMLLNEETEIVEFLVRRGVASEVALELSDEIAFVELDYPEWKGKLGPDDFVYVGRKSIFGGKYRLNLSEPAKRMLYNLARFSVKDIFPELKVSPDMNEEDVVRKLKGFLKQLS